MECKDIEKELEDAINNWNKSKTRIAEIDKVINEQLEKAEEDISKIGLYFFDEEIEKLKKERESKKSWMHQYANDIVNRLKKLQDSGCELKNIKF